MEKLNIHVDIHEAYRYMGCCGALDANLEKELQNAAKLIENSAQPRFIEKICRIDRSDGIALIGTCLKLEGKSIAALLHDCEICAIFCATIGNYVEALIRKWQLKDLAFTAMLDACASSAVESLCDNIEAKLTEEYRAQDLFLTDRFSPGYSDLPIFIQHDFCATLDTTRKIGVSVTESGIMIPRKTVTAIIGISKNPQKHFITNCQDCGLTKACTFKEKGVTCYGQAI